VKSKVVLHFIITAIFLTGCTNEEQTFTSVKIIKSPLIAGIPSYSSPEEIQNSYFKDKEWNIVDEDNLAPDDPRPPFNFLTVSCSDYEHLGYLGDLTLVFFNNRLMVTRFFPQDFDGYKKALRINGILLQNDRETRIVFTDMGSAINYKNETFVDWVDVRLKAEVLEWVHRYS
jgi:hypothetical protein